MKRNAYFDNAKLLFISLVVFGHMIQPFVEGSHAVGTLYTWIYTFHMPAFILLAGFFAKGSGDLAYILTLAKKLIIPYIVFQVLYTGYYFLIGKSNWLTDSIFYPHWSLWFLFSLFCWHLLLILYRKFRPALGITIAVAFGVIVGYFDHVGHTFSLSRTFVFFPYFLIGYWLSKEQLLFVKRKNIKIISLLVMIVVAVVIYYLPHIQTGWLLASKSYSTLGMELYGGIVRLIVYVTASVMTVSVLAWIPEKRFSFTVLGERTLYVYLLHGFFIQYFRQIDLFRVDHIGDVIGIAVISVFIVFVLSSKYIVAIWQPIIEISASKLKAIFYKNKSNERQTSA